MPNPFPCVTEGILIKDDGTRIERFPLSRKVVTVLGSSIILRILHCKRSHSILVFFVFRWPIFGYVLLRPVLPHADTPNGFIDNWSQSIMSQIIPVSSTPTKYSASPHAGAQESTASADSKNCKLCRKRLLNEHFYNPKTGLLFSVCDICRKRKRDKYWSPRFASLSRCRKQGAVATVHDEYATLYAQQGESSSKGPRLRNGESERLPRGVLSVLSRVLQLFYSVAE